MELTRWSIAVQRLAASLDRVTRERGVLGIADVAADITAANRELEWRCNHIIRSHMKE